MKKNDDNSLDSNEKKLDYVIRTLNLATKDIAKRLGVSSAFISQLKNNYKESIQLRNIHMYAICFAYDIPIEIFENRKVDTKNKINKLLEEQKKAKSIFRHNKEVLEKLLGTWYLYSYPSNPRLGEVWETETTFYDNYHVDDEHQNRGKLYVGQNQSIILKESNGSKNITSITFDNCRIFYNVFLFSRVSKSNSINKELFNFGICSRKKLDIELVKDVLGDVNQVQLQMNYDILERIGSCIEMDG